MIGAIMTPVGIPALANFSIARNRSVDDDARGSRTLWSSASSVVTLSATETAFMRGTLIGFTLGVAYFAVVIFIVWVVS